MAASKSMANFMSRVLEISNKRAFVFMSISDGESPSNAAVPFAENRPRPLSAYIRSMVSVWASTLISELMFRS